METPPKTMGNLPVLELFFDNLHLAVAILDRNLKIIKVNPTFARYSYRPVTDFPGHYYFDLYPVPEAEILFKNTLYTKKKMQGKSYAYFNPRRPNSRVVYWDWTLTPVLDQNGAVQILVLILQDVTAQINQEPALQVTRGHFVHPDSAYFTLDDKWCFTYVTKDAEYFLGEKAQALLGKNIWQLYPQLINSTLYTYAHDAMQKQIPFHFEYQIRHHENRWYILNVNPAPDGLTVTVVDISQRKIIEQKLQQNQKRLEVALEINKAIGSTEQEIMALALEGMVKLTGSSVGGIAFLSANGTWWQITTHPQPGLEKQHRQAEVQATEIDNQHLLQSELLMINNYQAQPVPLLLPGGHAPPKRILNLPFYDRGRMVMIAMMANKEDDYTHSDTHQLLLLQQETWNLVQRKRVEAKLRESEEKFRCFLDNIRDGLFILNPDGEIVTANPALAQMVGHSPAELRNITDIIDYRIDLLLKKVEQTGLGQGLFNFIHKNGAKIPVEATLVKYQVEGGRAYIGGIVRDLRENIKTQRQLMQLERLNLVGQLAAGIGHEVRNPLTVVRGFIQLLNSKEKYKQEKGYFDVILKELDRANDIITNYLSLARNKTATREKANLNYILHNLYPLLSSHALSMDKNLTFTPGPLPDLMLNKMEIHQLILNLVRNALEATPAGSVVRIKTFMDPGEVVLTIEDEGPGIDEAILNRLGTPFLTTKEQGTGLGLSTSYSIAREHNAVIDVDTGPGGTTFAVRFKIDTDPQPPAG